MSNPMITVISALYGLPGNVHDVTAAVQGIFDQQYTGNKTPAFVLKSIGPSLFNIPDPDYGTLKAFTIVYNLPTVGADLFMRGAHDSENLTLTAGPARTIQVTRAIYATNDFGLDVTDKLNAYLRDPGNSSALKIGGSTFLEITGDPAPGAMKYFGASYTDTASPNQTKSVCGYDTQTVNIS
jgi:hypothetical protein